MRSSAGTIASSLKSAGMPPPSLSTSQAKRTSSSGEPRCRRTVSSGLVILLRR